MIRIIDEEMTKKVLGETYLGVAEWGEERKSVLSREGCCYSWTGAIYGSKNHGRPS